MQFSDSSIDNILRRKMHFFVEEKENGDNIWSRIIYFFVMKEKRKMFGEEKYIFWGGKKEKS